MNDTWLADAPSIPKAHTFGQDREEASSRAVDAVTTALSLYIEYRCDIPLPTLCVPVKLLSPSPP